MGGGQRHWLSAQCLAGGLVVMYSKREVSGIRGHQECNSTLAGEGAGAGGKTGPAAAAALAPSAAASLAESGQHAAAAAIAASHLGVHPALFTLGGGLSMLGPYLRGTARAVEAAAPAQGPVNDAEDVSVPHAIEQVWGMLSGQCDRALSRLRQDAP